MTEAKSEPNATNAENGTSNGHHSHSATSSQQQQHKIDNPMPHLLPEGENATPLEVISGQTVLASDKLVIVMVGLPATGKTHIAKRICRFLSFFHSIPSQIFNVGDYRRQLCGAQQPAEFYDPTNPQGLAARTAACDAALTDLLDYIRLPGTRVAAFDATNSTKARRKHIRQTLRDNNHLGVRAKVMMVESICDQEELLEENIRKVKLATPDYRDMDPESAVLDFRQRRANYMSVYEPVDETEGPSIKIINSKQFIVNNIRGYLPLKVVHFVMNLHTLPRTFYLTRHGQSHYNMLGKIGGDSGLTPNGIEYAKRLAQFCKEYVAVDPNNKSSNSGENDDNGNGDNNADNSNNNEEGQQRPARLWTSTLRRTKETAQFIEHNKMEHTWDNGETGDWVQFRPMARRNLDELYAGTCDGMTYKEIEQVFPEEFQRRQQDKLTYRYPRGESYMDVILRLEPLAQEMERTREPVVIVGHQGILRILYAYMMGMDRKEAPYVSIPLNNVIELTPHAYGCHEKRYCLMLKEEMLQDGQDEPPVTSMPMPRGSVNLHGGTTAAMMTTTTTTTTTHTVILPSVAATTTQASEYEPNDPVMNAPSH